MSSLVSVQIRRGTKAEWDASNALLLEGEIGFESNTYRFKIGKRDRFSRKLIPWRELEYASPYSGKDKPVYPQAGDFWVEDVVNEEDRLYFYDGLSWVGLLGQKDTNLEGSINIENACFTGDFLPCMDDAFNIGSPNKRWKNAHFSNSIRLSGEVNQYVITEGSTDDNDIPRIQINGYDIALRPDFDNVTSANLDLFNPSGPGGPDLINPTYIERYNTDVVPTQLPPQNNIQTQSQYNEWVYVAMQSLDDSVTSITGDEDNVCGGLTNFYNESQFHCQLIANNGVRVPLETSSTTDDLGTAQSKYFLRADGTISNKLPMEQSYWKNVPRRT